MFVSPAANPINDVGIKTEQYIFDRDSFFNASINRYDQNFERFYDDSSQSSTMEIQVSRKLLLLSLLFFFSFVLGHVETIVCGEANTFDRRMNGAVIETKGKLDSINISSSPFFASIYTLAYGHARDTRKRSVREWKSDTSTSSLPSFSLFFFLFFFTFSLLFSPSPPFLQTRDTKRR